MNVGILQQNPPDFVSVGFLSIMAAGYSHPIYSDSHIEKSYWFFKNRNGITEIGE